MIGKYVILAVVIAGTGIGLQKWCYRFPTVEEMKEYHEGHYSTEILSMQQEQKDDIMLFRAKHGNRQGFTERYKVETGRAWVLPWETYWESRERMKEEK